MVAIAPTDQREVVETHSACGCWLSRRFPVRSACDVAVGHQYERHGRRKRRARDEHVRHAL